MTTKLIVSVFDDPDLTSGAIMGQNSNSQLASDKLKMVNMV